MAHGQGLGRGLNGLGAVNVPVPPANPNVPHAHIAHNGVGVHHEGHNAAHQWQQQQQAQQLRLEQQRQQLRHQQRHDQRLQQQQRRQQQGIHLPRHQARQAPPAPPVIPLSQGATAAAEAIKAKQDRSEMDKRNIEKAKNFRNTVEYCENRMSAKDRKEMRGRGVYDRADPEFYEADEYFEKLAKGETSAGKGLTDGKEEKEGVVGGKTTDDSPYLSPVLSVGEEDEGEGLAMWADVDSDHSDHHFDHSKKFNSHVDSNSLVHLSKEKRKREVSPALEALSRGGHGEISGKSQGSRDEPKSEKKEERKEKREMREMREEMEKEARKVLKKEYTVRRELSLINEEEIRLRAAQESAIMYSYKGKTGEGVGKAAHQEAIDSKNMMKLKLKQLRKKKELLYGKIKDFSALGHIPKDHSPKECSSEERSVQASKRPDISHRTLRNSNGTYGPSSSVRSLGSLGKGGGVKGTGKDCYVGDKGDKGITSDKGEVDGMGGNSPVSSINYYQSKEEEEENYFHRQRNILLREKENFVEVNREMFPRKRKGASSSGSVTLDNILKKAAKGTLSNVPENLVRNGGTAGGNDGGKRGGNVGAGEGDREGDKFFGGIEREGEDLFSNEDRAFLSAQAIKRKEGERKEGAKKVPEKREGFTKCEVGDPWALSHKLAFPEKYPNDGEGGDDGSDSGDGDANEGGDDGNQYDVSSEGGDDGNGKDNFCDDESESVEPLNGGIANYWSDDSSVGKEDRRLNCGRKYQEVDNGINEYEKSAEEDEYDEDDDGEEEEDSDDDENEIEVEEAFQRQLIEEDDIREDMLNFFQDDGDDVLDALGGVQNDRADLEIHIALDEVLGVRHNRPWMIMFRNFFWLMGFNFAHLALFFGMSTICTAFYYLFFLVYFFHSFFIRFSILFLF